jgi:pyridoxal phosphate enzyme (YggS family)
VISAADVADRLAAVRARIVAAGGGDHVEVLAVTKGFGPEAVLAAVGAGCTRIGENYAQELLAKRDALGGWPAVEVHFIGRLQSNKVRSIAGAVDVVESVDRASLVTELARRSPGQRVLVQVDTTGDPGKGGCPVDEVVGLVEVARAAGLAVEGLMTVGPTEGPPEAARDGFRIVRALVDELGLATCSMGMSGDLEVAVDEGSTQVRIGSALFGARPPAPST